MQDQNQPDRTCVTDYGQAVTDVNGQTVITEFKDDSHIPPDVAARQAKLYEMVTGAQPITLDGLTDDQTYDVGTATASEGEAIDDVEMKLADLSPQFRRFFDLYQYVTVPERLISHGTDLIVNPAYDVFVEKYGHTFAEIPPAGTVVTDNDGNAIVDVRGTFEAHLNYFARSQARYNEKHGVPHTCSSTIERPRKADFKVHRHTGWFWKPGGKQQYNAAMRAFDKQMTRQTRQDAIVASALGISVAELLKDHKDAPKATCHPARGGARDVNHEGARNILRAKHRNVRRAARRLYGLILARGSMPVQAFRDVLHPPAPSTIALADVKAA